MGLRIDASTLWKCRTLDVWRIVSNAFRPPCPIFVCWQHLPAADCGEQLPATGGGAGGKNATGGLADDDDSDDDNDDDYYDDVEGDDDVSAAATSTATAAAGTPPAAGDNTGGAGAGEEGRENGGGGKKRRPQAKKKKGRARTMGVESDAQLSCPLCFTTVCLECQRHALYFNQARTTGPAERKVVL